MDIAGRMYHEELEESEGKKKAILDILVYVYCLLKKSASTNS